MLSMLKFGLTALSLASLGMSQTFNCQITIPPNPLTAQGLASVYKVTGCNQIDFSNQGSFVEASILDTDTGAIQIYHPLVVNQDNAYVHSFRDLSRPLSEVTKGLGLGGWGVVITSRDEKSFDYSLDHSDSACSLPMNADNIFSSVAGVDFIAPVVPTLPANNVVGIWFGSNAATVKLVGSTNGCVNGLGDSLFGQFAYCNTPAFFTAAEKAVAAGLLTIPAPGSTTKAATTQACPVVRDFRVVDMDQSDNVDTTYLLIDGKKLAQNTAANAAANKNSTVLSNGSDNALVNDFLAPTLGCTPFTASSITAPSGTSGGLSLNVR